MLPRSTPTSLRVIFMVATGRSAPSNPTTSWSVAVSSADKSKRSVWNLQSSTSKMSMCNLTPTENCKKLSLATKITLGSITDISSFTPGAPTISSSSSMARSLSEMSFGNSSPKSKGFPRHLDFNQLDQVSVTSWHSKKPSSSKASVQPSLLPNSWANLNKQLSCSRVHATCSSGPSNPQTDGPNCESPCRSETHRSWRRRLEALQTLQLHPGTRRRSPTSQPFAIRNWMNSKVVEHQTCSESVHIIFQLAF